MRCVEMLVNIINSYDEQLREAVDKLYEEYRKKVE
jgi:hypothetical protein